MVFIKRLDFWVFRFVFQRKEVLWSNRLIEVNTLLVMLGQCTLYISKNISLVCIISQNYLIMQPKCCAEHIKSFRKCSKVSYTICGFLKRMLFRIFFNYASF